MSHYRAPPAVLPSLRDFPAEVKAISDDIPRSFSEVLLCYAEGAAWYWDTAASNAVRKTRYLPIHNKIPQDLSRIWSEWLKRKEGM